VNKVARMLGVVLVVAGLGLGLVACGGDDDDSSSADAGSNTTLSESDIDKAAGATNVDKECIKAVQAFANIGANANPAGGNETQLEDAVKAFKAYAKAAPGAIRDAVSTVADAYVGFYEAMKDSGYDPSSGKPPTSDQIQALQDASEKLDDAKVKAASDKVTAYFDEHCKNK